MGNCCRRGSSSMVWAGDEWESSMASEKEDEQPAFDKQRILSHLKASSSSSSRSFSGLSGGGSTSTTEVKIKITKKELEELLGKADVQNLSSEQVFSRLINASNGRYTVHQHDHWRPGLTSIPEVN
ncbi:uncharacterized protein LOC116207121 [Punica granatum]|uniref:Uncharacterized protein n=2 Tax=Punica granatum TaxID=22663 RepID=A0A218XM66_PUNGR|nr:uncharacterized protein LOC116207121 [Punica granatum]OWM86345.1 hypothetical protein CDL15_Pgr010687 [Punica granatum]PKI61034.1 hypothetical protein CRG98_018596 [Punica granatum]